MVERTFVALDLETTGLNSKRDAIIEIGAIRLRNGRIEDEFSTLVNPDRPISLFIEQITGIGDADVASAPRLDAVIPELLAFVDGSVEGLIAHNAKFDLGFLKAAGVHFHRPAYDTYELATILLPHAPSYSLGELALLFQIPLDNAHRAAADARATALLFDQLRRHISELPAPYVRTIATKGAESGWPAHQLFIDALPSCPEMPDALPPSAPNPTTGEGTFPPPVTESVNAFFEEKGGLAVHLGDGFEARAGQVAMAQLVLDALVNGEQRLIEAGTGIGKSLAYLLPAALWSRANGERVLISTHTLALQEQLLEQEIPRLSRILAASGGRPLESTLLKGRSHYLCTRRLHRWYHNRKLTRREMRFLARILAWLPTTTSGDLDELSIYDSKERALLGHVASHGAECSDERCGGPTPDDEPHPFSRQYRDFYIEARRRAESADLLVVNHALLLADLQTGGRVLPAYDHLIVDEAHHLEEAATGQLTFRIGQETIESVLADMDPDLALLRLLRDDPETLRLAKKLSHLSREPNTAITYFVERLSTFAGRHMNKKQAGFPQRLPVDGAARVQPEWSDVEIAWEELRTPLRDVVRAGRNLVQRLEKKRWADDPQRGPVLQRFRLAQDRGAALIEELDHTIFQPVGESETITWIEIESKKAPATLCSAPLQVSSLLDEALFRPLRSLILTGATLRTGAGFDFMRDRLGCWEADVSVIESPFDYRRNALLFTPSDMPTPDRQGYQRAVEQAIVDGARAARGRTLVLFTSYAHLRTTADKIRGRLDQEGITVLQHGSGSRSRALREFRTGEPSVLLATGAFWEGIDLPGEQLSCLMIVRLPFAVPSDPLHAARGRLYEDGFGEYALPDAVLRFRQGFGRLIRRADDRGVVVLLDSRIWQKSYGDAFLDALPSCTRRHAPLMNLGETISDWLAGQSWALGGGGVDFGTLFGDR